MGDLENFSDDSGSSSGRRKEAESAKTSSPLAFIPTSLTQFSESNLTLKTLIFFFLLFSFTLDNRSGQTPHPSFRQPDPLFFGSYKTDPAS